MFAIPLHDVSKVSSLAPFVMYGRRTGQKEMEFLVYISMAHSFNHPDYNGMSDEYREILTPKDLCAAIVAVGKQYRPGREMDSPPPMFYFASHYFRNKYSLSTMYRYLSALDPFILTEYSGNLDTAQFPSLASYSEEEIAEMRKIGYFFVPSEITDVIANIGASNAENRIPRSDQKNLVIRAENKEENEKVEPRFLDGRYIKQTEIALGINPMLRWTVPTGFIQEDPGLISSIRKIRKIYALCKSSLEFPEEPLSHVSAFVGQLRDPRFILAKINMIIAIAGPFEEMELYNYIIGMRDEDFYFKFMAGKERVQDVFMLNYNSNTLRYVSRLKTLKSFRKNGRGAKNGI